MQFSYTEFAVGLKDRGKILHVSEIAALLETNKTNDCYSNTLWFDSSFKDFVANTSSVSGYRGIGYMKYFPIDIDDSDLEKAQKIAIDFLESIGTQVPVDFFKIFFSGNKGFHIMIPSNMIGSKPSENISQQMKVFAELLLNIPYDTTIYNHVRLFRIPNTKHQKSGLYKIPITYKDLLTLDITSIKEMAQTPVYLDLPFYKGEPSAYLQALWGEAVKKAVKIYDLKVEKIDENSEHRFPCHKNLANNGASEGYRNSASLRMAWILKKTGLPTEMAWATLQEWNKKNRPPLEINELKTVLTQAYKGKYAFNCSDPIFQMFCEDTCPYAQKREEKEEIKFADMSQIGQSYRKLIDLYTTDKMGLGHYEIDKYLRGLLPGFVLSVLARTGVGKTSFAIDCMQRMIGEWNQPIVFFSLEMSKEMILERFLARYLDVDAKKIPDLAQSSSFNSILYDLEKKFKKLKIVDESGLTVDDMERYIQFVEQRILGEKVRVIFIDYLGLISSNASTEYQQMSERILALQKLAKKMSLSIVVLIQTNRTSGGNGGKEIDLDAGRGSGVIEEVGDAIFGLWAESANQLYLKILKNRFGVSGKTFQCNVNFSKSYRQLIEMPEIIHKL